jgi:steroid delta-isomerase-like uncharacterized protein
LGGLAFTDAAALCASPEVDVVYVATPHAYHADQAVLAASSGKHVLVDKPMALTLEDCDRMIDSARRSGVGLIVGHTASFNPAIPNMRELIVSGDVRPLAVISATAYTDFLYRPRRPDELVTQRGGGIMYNQVPHQVDAAFFTFEGGAVASVYSGYDHFLSAALTSAQSRAMAPRVVPCAALVTPRNSKLRPSAQPHQVQPAMSNDEIETHYCQYINEVFNYHRLDSVAGYLAADVVSHADGITVGRDGACDLVRLLVSAFPDFHMTIDALAVVDSELVARLTASGTQTGTFLGVPPTGRRVRVCAFGAWQLRDGQCTEQWLQLDLTELVQQLGATLSVTPMST